MKKKPNGFVSVLLALCLLLAPMTVFAESNAQLNYVTDDVGILTDSQWEDLEQRAQQVSEEYQCGVYMITVDDYTDYSTESVYTADYTIYHDYEDGHGRGPGRHYDPAEHGGSGLCDVCIRSEGF